MPEVSSSFMGLQKRTGAVLGSWALVWTPLLCSEVLGSTHTSVPCLGSLPDCSICQWRSHTSRPKEIYFDPALFSYLSILLFLV